LVAERFDAGRTFNDQWPNAPLHCDLAQVTAMNSDGLTFAQLRPRLEDARREGAWMVLGGHEFGETGRPATTAATTVDAVVRWCRDHGVWVDTVGAVARHVATLARPPASARPERRPARAAGRSCA
jgi:hypothetical protein